MKSLGDYMRTGRYILIGQSPVEEPDLMKWAQWMEEADLVVKQEYVERVMVSTVFLALDHRYGNGPPLLFETMAWFDGEVVEGVFGRCATWLQAEEMHRAKCDEARRWIAVRQVAGAFRKAVRE